MILIQTTLELHMQNTILEFDCVLSDCNWVNQAQLKQPWSFYSIYACRSALVTSSSRDSHSVSHICSCGGNVISITAEAWIRT